MLAIHDGKPWTLSVLGNSTGDMSDVTASDSGTVAAYLSYINDVIGSNAGTAYTGVCDSGMTGSTTTIVCDDLAGKGDDFYNTDWVMVVLHNVNSDGNAPEGNSPRDIADYVSATGTFTVTAFSANVEENDVILVARRENFLIDGVSVSGTPATGSLTTFIATGGTSLGTALPASKSLYDFLLTTDTAGTHDITTGNDKVETDVVEITDTTKYGLSMYFDLSTLVTAGEGGTVTIRMKNKIDESTYRQIGSATFIVGSTLTYPNFSENRLNHNVKFTIECSTDVTVTRQINYRYVKEPKE